MQRVDRRRRVLVDESRNDSAPRIFRGDDDPVPARTSRYTDAALQALNAPIAAYLPLRRWSLALWFFGGLLPIFVLVLLDHVQSPLASSWGTLTTQVTSHSPTTVHPFDLDGRGNVAAWFSSMLFGVAAMIMLAVHSVRQHRRDDFRGKFLVWRWGVAAALLASLDATAGIHRLWQGACSQVLGHANWGNGSFWWVSSWSVIFGTLLVRVLMEMYPSFRSAVWTTVAMICYAYAAAIQLRPSLLAPFGISDQYASCVSQMAILLLGHHFLVFGLVSYAHDVVLEAMGRQVVRKKRRKLAVDEQSDDNVQKSSSSEKGTSRQSYRSDRKEEKKPVVVPHNDDADDMDEPMILATEQAREERRQDRKEKKRRAA